MVVSLAQTPENGPEAQRAVAHLEEAALPMADTLARMAQIVPMAAPVPVEAAVGSLPTANQSTTTEHPVDT
jgi:hypothetical protein